MQCEKCGKDRRVGNKYSFFYGNRSAPEIHDYKGIQRVISTHYDYTIAGQASAWICDSCVRRAQLAHNVPVIVILLFGLPLGYLTLTLTGTGNKFLVGIIVIGVLFIAIPILVEFMKKQEYGEKAAIRVREKEIRFPKYNLILTSAEYKKIRKT